MGSFISIAIIQVNTSDYVQTVKASSQFWLKLQNLTDQSKKKITLLYIIMIIMYIIMIHFNATVHNCLNIKGEKIIHACREQTTYAL